MKAVSATAKKHKLWVVEDYAQSIDAHGPWFQAGRAQRRRLHQLYYPEKSRHLWRRGRPHHQSPRHIELAVRRMRNYGSLKRSAHSFGFNSRLDNFHAAFLSVKLKHISKVVRRRT
jgi:dTDP-4-amino-4,6-dideoxygalactose transaminase